MKKYEEMDKINTNGTFFLLEDFFKTIFEAQELTKWIVVTI